MKEDADENLKKMTDFIDKEENELDTHFVDNPYIRVRERTTRKLLEAKNQMGA